MGKVSIRAEREKILRKVAETIDGTIIHQRQRELIPGRWDFVVFGPSASGKEAVLRVGVAEQMVIHRASVYVASVGDPERIGHQGMMTIEELTGGDVADELKGLEIYHVTPLRPMNILDRRRGKNLERMRDKAFEEFSDVNTAIIETPDEQAWSLSVLRYLHECDESFPDPLMSVIRSKLRDTSIDFGGLPDTLH